jgi:TonB family protein
MFLLSIFAPYRRPYAVEQNTAVIVSLALHGLLLAWLLYPSEPALVNPVYVARGEGGHVVTRLYWPNGTIDDGSSNASEDKAEKRRSRQLAHAKLIWKRHSSTAIPATAPISPSETDDNSKAESVASLGHGALAGTANGTLINGSATGEEIRPALPVQTVDPVAYPWELPEAEGNVVVEITIDERGEIVKKAVLQSLGSKLDEKALAALSGWHFHPATRNGVAIASKQDAVFHFRHRG